MTITEFITARLDEWERRDGNRCEIPHGPFTISGQTVVIVGHGGDSDGTWTEVSVLDPIRESPSWVAPWEDHDREWRRRLTDDEEAELRNLSPLTERAQFVRSMVAALRAVVGLHKPYDVRVYRETQDIGPDHRPTGPYDVVPFCAGCDIDQEWPCPTLRHLAAAWAGHEDYDEGWRP